MAWDLNGNAGTNSANFLGTTDAQPLIVKTAGTERLRADTNGNIDITGTVFVSADINANGSLHAINVNAVQGMTTGSLATNGDAFVNGNMSVDGTLASGSANFNGNVIAVGSANFNGGVEAPVVVVKDTLSVFGVAALGNVGVSELNATGNVVIKGLLTPTGGVSAFDCTGNLTVAGDVLLTGADCAEQFDITGRQMPEPGTVVVIDGPGRVRGSQEAYDKKVAGVVSGAGGFKHGLLLDKRCSDEPRVPVALVGKVYCKVDAQYSPIQVGDLLTTSSTPGHAMKASDPLKAFGSVLGKALESLNCGRGLVPILVTLQ